MKNDNHINVLRGHSVSEMVLSPQPVHYTGIDRPQVVVALASLALLANMNRMISTEMLKAALAVRYKKVILDSAMELVDRGGELS